MNLRGLGGNYGAQRVLIMQDGRPLNEEYMGDVELRLIPVDNIERVEIVKGPVSALYGSYAMGGVINIITKRGQEKPLLDFTNSLGDYNTQTYRLRYGAKQGPFNYFLTAARDSTDGYLLNPDGSKRDWLASHLDGKMEWAFDPDTSLSLSLGYNGSEGEQRDFFQELSRNYYDLTYATNWASERQAKLLVRGYRNGLNQDLDWKQAHKTGIYDQFTCSGQIQQSYLLTAKHLLTGGIDIKQEDVDVKELSGKVEQEINNYALYLQDEFCLSRDKTYLTLGIRYDRTSSFGGEFSPRTGLTYHLNEKITLHTSVGKAYRSPAVSDLYLPTTSYFGMTFMGNPDLGPERIWSYELGAKYDFTSGLRANGNLYYSKVKDGWDYMRDPDTIYRPRNVAEQTIKGVEFDLNWEIIKTLSASGNLSYTNSEYDKYESEHLIEGNRTEDIPRYSGYGEISYKDNENHSVSLQFRGNGLRYGDPQNTSAEKLPGYLVVNLSTSLPLQKNIKLFTSLNNLFDRHYKDNPDYRQPGRSFMIGTTISF